MYKVNPLNLAKNIYNLKVFHKELFPVLHGFENCDLSWRSVQTEWVYEEEELQGILFLCSPSYGQYLPPLSCKLLI